MDLHWDNQLTAAKSRQEASKLGSLDLTRVGAADL
jgi:hypothetical protein